MSMAQALRPPPALVAVLPMPRSDVTVVMAREDRTPRRRQRGEIYSTDDRGPPARRMLRNIRDARLAEALGPTLYSAMGTIDAAFRRLTAGMGHKPPNWQGFGRAPFNPNRATAADVLADRWVAWGEMCKAAGINLHVVIAVIIDGESPRALDRRNGRASNWTLDQVKRAITLWLSPRSRLAQNVRRGAR